ncbi:MAG: DsbA family protein [Balneolaceae bacterium]|nr:DsbA family protein [Balneolaceae bacterium]
MNKPTLIYAYDPLCGWCFGFHPVMERLARRFENDLNIKVMAGGLAIGENIQSISEGFGYILQASKQVESVTGVKFGRNFYMLAEEGSYLYNSEPSCIAQNVVNEISPEHSLQFAGMMQNALFKDGKSLNDWNTYEELMGSLSINAAAAKELFESDRIKQKTYNTFEWCKENGASAFPTLLINIGEETGAISRGYRPFDTIESHLHHLINNFKKLHS